MDRRDVDGACLCTYCYETHYLPYVRLCIEAGHDIPTEWEWVTFGGWSDRDKAHKYINEQERDLIDRSMPKWVIVAMLNLAAANGRYNKRGIEEHPGTSHTRDAELYMTISEMVARWHDPLAGFEYNGI